MDERYHYSNGSIAACESFECPFLDHHTLAGAVQVLRTDETNSFYSSGGDQ